MIKKLCIFLILINITCILSGCWGKKELAQMSIVTALGIDKEEDKFVVSVQIINPMEISKYGGGGSPVTIFAADGDTVLEAITKLSVRLPQKLYLAHLRILVFGDKFAHSGITESLDFFERHSEPRSDFFVVQSRDCSAYDSLRVLTPIEKIPANKIYNSLDISQKYWSAAHAVSLFQLIRDFQTPIKNSVINTLIIEGSPDSGSNVSNVRTVNPETRLKIGYLAVIKNGKVIDYLTERESAAYNAIQGKIHHTVMSLKTPKGLIGYEVKYVRVKIIPYLKDNELRIKIRVDESGNIAEVQSNIDLTNIENIKKIETIIAEDSEAKLKELIVKAQDELQCDFLGLYAAVHRKYPKIYKDHQEDWDSFFPSIPIEFEIHSRITTFGIIRNATH